MKLLFITQEDPIYVAEFWEEFKNYRDELKKSGIEITGLVSLEPLGQSSKVKLFKKVFSPYGLFGTFKLGIQYLLKRYRTVKYYAALMNVPYYNVQKLHSDEFLDFSRQQDIIFSVAASRKFKKKLLDAPKYGCYNIHSGPLPKYRGMMPVFWQIHDGNKKIGITIHKMDEELDNGDIVMQEFIDISNIRTVHEVMIKTKHFGANMVRDFLLNFDKLKDSLKPNDNSCATYYSFPTRKNAKQIKKMGVKLI